MRLCCSSVRIEKKMVDKVYKISLMICPIVWRKNSPIKCGWGTSNDGNSWTQNKEISRNTKRAKEKEKPKEIKKKGEKGKTKYLNAHLVYF